MKTRIVRNQSSRNGSPIRRIILHTTEGFDAGKGTDVENLAAFFDNPATNASSHVGIDRHGEGIRMVQDDRKAWTAGNANPDSLNVELCGHARFNRAEWLARPKQLAAVASLVGHWARKHNIPLKFNSKNGVCGHVHVSGAGGHWDPGPKFPYDVVLELAGSGGMNDRATLLRRLRIAYAARKRQTTRLMVERMNRRIRTLKSRLRRAK